MRDVGIRGRFAYGTWQGGPAPDDPMDIADLTRMHRDWDTYKNEGLLTLGRPRAASARRRVRSEPRSHSPGLGCGAGLGLPITLHTAQRRRRNSRAREIARPRRQLINRRLG